MLSLRGKSTLISNADDESETEPEPEQRNCFFYLNKKSQLV